MNNGKICVSICAKTTDEMIQKIKQAQSYADLIEIRGDCFDPSELDTASSLLREESKKLPNLFLLRFRSSEGGNSFHKLDADLDLTVWGADFELDMEGEAWAWLWQHRIFSHHDFSGVPEDLTAIYKKLRAEKGTAVKVAVFANDAVDAIPLWHLLERAVTDHQTNETRLKISGISPGLDDGNTRFIPIAMGEAGKWTRILGLAHGAFMTYASLGEGDETAPGQITARDLIETYRVKALDKSAEVYCVIGDPVATSLSPYIHNPVFAAEGVNAVFIPMLVKDLDAFMRRMVLDTREVELNFRGFAVTMPHKQAIIKYLDEIDATAHAIGAVNTLKIAGGKLTGYNTDAEGFIEPLKSLYHDLNNARVAVLGAGGAARACVFALQSEKCDVTIFARDIKKGEELAEQFDCDVRTLDRFEPGTFDIVVNATPVGMTGNDEANALLTAEQLEGVKLVYDLVTSPPETSLMSQARIAGVQAIGGLEMLIAQATRQFEIWTGRRADIELMRKSAIAHL